MNYQERNAIIVMMMKDGAKLSDVAELYGITRQRVCQILQAANLPPDIGQRKRRQRHLAERREELAKRAMARRVNIEDRLSMIVQMQRSGMTQAEIGAIVGLSQGAIAQFLIYHGIRSYPPHARKPSK